MIADAPEWVYAFRAAGVNRPQIVQPPAYACRSGTSPLVERALANLKEPLPPIADVVAALAAVSNPNLGWDEWNRILMAAWAATAGSEAGREAARAWSQKSRKHTHEGLNARWSHYERSPPTDLGFGTLVWEARAAVPGWEPPSRLKSFQANGVHALPPGFDKQDDPIVFPDKEKGGRLKATCANAVVALKGMGIAGEYDEFHDKLRIAGHELGAWAGDVVDNAVHMLRVMCRKTYSLDPGTVHMHDAIVQLCLQSVTNPVLAYFDSIRWDQTPRLDTWMIRYLGAADTPFNREVSRISLTAAVHRAANPGCKFDQIIVLEGPEGRGKSSAIEILAGSENFSDQTVLSLDDRGQQEAVQGVWLFEIADLAGHGRADIERVKAFASRTYDRARPAYGRTRVDRPRRCIFFATTNDTTYLKSQTGNRRFWPVPCGRIDLAALAKDRDQLWAEACERAENRPLVLDESFWSEAAALQDARRDHDPWDDALTGDLGFVFPTAQGYEWRAMTYEIMDGRLKLPADRQNDVSAKRVAFVMRRLGWDGPKTFREGKSTCKGYTRPAVSAEWEEQLKKGKHVKG